MGEGGQTPGPAASAAPMQCDPGTRGAPHQCSVPSCPCVAGIRGQLPMVGVPAQVPEGGGPGGTGGSPRARQEGKGPTWVGGRGRSHSLTLSQLPRFFFWPPHAVG